MSHLKATPEKLSTTLQPVALHCQSAGLKNATLLFEENRTYGKEKQKLTFTVRNKNVLASPKPHSWHLNCTGYVTLTNSKADIDLFAQ